MKKLISKNYLPLIPEQSPPSGESGAGKGKLLCSSLGKIFLAFQQFTIEEIEILSNSYDCDLLEQAVLLLIIAKYHTLIFKQSNDSKFNDDFERGLRFFEVIDKVQEKGLGFSLSTQLQGKNNKSNFYYLHKLKMRGIDVTKELALLIKEHYTDIRTAMEFFEDSVLFDKIKKIKKKRMKKKGLINFKMKRLRKELDQETLLRLIFYKSCMENHCDQIYENQQSWVYWRKRGSLVLVPESSNSKFLLNRKDMCSFSLISDFNGRINADFCFEIPECINTKLCQDFLFEELDEFNSYPEMSYKVKVFDNTPSIIIDRLSLENKQARKLNFLLKKYLKCWENYLAITTENKLVVFYRPDLDEVGAEEDEGSRSGSLAEEGGVESRIDRFFESARHFLKEEYSLFLYKEEASLSYNKKGKIKEVLKSNDCKRKPNLNFRAFIFTIFFPNSIKQKLLFLFFV